MGLQRIYGVRQGRENLPVPVFPVALELGVLFLTKCVYLGADS